MATVTSCGKKALYVTMKARVKARQRDLKLDIVLRIT